MGKEFVIRFPKNLNTATFEKTLSKYYGQSKTSLNSAVKFDLKRTEWIDIFELSLLSLWIKELLSITKKIKIVLPDDNRLKDFLQRYDFLRFLQENNININIDFRIENLDLDLIRTPYFPLKYYSEREFQEFYRYISDDRNFNDVFRDLKNIPIGRGQSLRNIIIKELADNMFHHAKGEFSNIIMSKFGKDYAERTSLIKWRDALIKNSIGNEKEFFADLAGRKYITIVIADKGVGIFDTLYDAWTKDENNQQANDPSECELIKYSVLEYSSSKPDEVRYGDLIDLFDKSFYENEPPKLPGPTGLFQVFNTAKENNGFLMIRSGSSIVSYNFFNKQRRYTIFENEKSNNYRNLTNFGGTQIKIHFPIDFAYSNQQVKENPPFKQTKFIFPESKKIDSHFFVSLNDYEVDSTQTADKQVREIIKFYKTVDDVKKNHKQNAGIILDLCNGENIPHKVINFFVSKLMDSQEDTFTHVLINLNPQSVSILKTTFQKNLSNYLPIVLFDSTYKRHIIGISREKENLFNTLYNKPRISLEEASILKEYKHIFFEANEELILKHNRASIIKHTVNAITLILRKEIFNSNNRIFSKDIKVIMPNGIFCEGFFEISKILSSGLLRSRIKQWMLAHLILGKPDFIVSAGRPCITLLDEIYVESVQQKKKIRAKHFKIEKPLKIDFNQLYTIGSQIGKDAKVIVFTDVVGTKKSTYNILRNLNHVKEIELITIINASDENPGKIKIGDKVIDLKVLVNYPLKFFDTKPNEWQLEDLVKVDENTNDLIRAKTEKKKSIWEIVDHNSQFAPDSIIKEDNYVFGHFTHDNTHLPLLFQMEQICNKFSVEIGDAIIKHFLFEHDKSYGFTNPEEWLICFLDDKPELNTIASYLSKKIYSNTWQISNREAVYENDLIGNEFYQKKILLIDDAIDTGDSLLRIIDLCNRKKASEVWVYIIIKRGSDYSIRKISNIKKYGDIERIEFNYLTEICIPTYREFNCPLCKKRIELQGLKEQLLKNKNLQKVSDYIANQELSISEVPFIYTKEKMAFVKRQTIKGEQNDLTIRLMIEEAKNNIIVYEKINGLINDYEKKPEELLKIIYHLNREDLFFLFDIKYGDEGFRKSQRRKLLAACVHFLKDSDKLDEADFDAIISTIRKLDEHRLIDRLFSILKTIHKNEKHLCILIINICLLKSTKLHLTNITATFNNFLRGIQINEANDRLKQLLNNLLSWLNTHKNISVSKKHFLSNYVELRQIIHTLVKDRNSITAFLNSRRFNEFQDFFKSYIISLDKLISLLHNFIGFDFFDHRIIEMANRVINRIQLIKDEVTFMVHKKINNSNNEEVALQFETTLRETNDLMPIGAYLANAKQQETINDLLQLAVTNLKDLCNYWLTQMELKFPSKKIQYEKLNIDESVIVFGDRNGIASIISNVIENVYEQPNTTKLKCSVRVNEKDKEVHLLIFDDGNLPNEIKADVGFDTINSNVERYSDKEFEIRKVLKSETEFREGYKTVASVFLSHIPNRKS